MDVLLSGTIFLCNAFSLNLCYLISSKTTPYLDLAARSDQKCLQLELTLDAKIHELQYWTPWYVNWLLLELCNHDKMLCL